MITERNEKDRFAVVGVDGSDESHLALAWAAEEVRLRRVRLHVVHAWSYPAASELALYASALGHADLQGEAEETCRRAVHEVLGDDPGFEVTSEVVGGSAAGALVGAAEGAELLVVGSRGRGGFAGLVLGSVSQQCASHAPCPVVIVPAAPHRHRG